jgi:hypothetical protein
MGETVCASACVDEQTDTGNCGSCGNRCAATGQTCGMGKCLCPSGQSVCAGACVDEQTDTGNCGACGTVCGATGQTCQAGMCACPMGDIVCGSACVDPQTDNSNCGACGSVCAGTCNDGDCLITLASGQMGASGLAVDAANVYWTDDSAGTVMQMPVGGGTPMTLASGQGSPRYIAIDATSVYWANYSSGEIMKAPIGGNATPTVLASGETAPTNIAVNAQDVVWIAGGASVRSVPVGGGSTPTSLTFYGGSDFRGLALRNNEVYVSEHGGPQVNYRIEVEPGAGGLPIYFGNLGSPCDVIAVDSTNVYFTNEGMYAVVKIPLSNPSDLGYALTTDTRTQGRHAIAVDSSNVYFTNASGEIVRSPIGGGGTILASSQGDSYGIAVDATSVYWTNPSAGTVVKLTPK